MTVATRHRLETYSGKFIDYDDPQAEQIDVRDIAHALSNIARFGGHTSQFYSVAQHSLLVRRLLRHTSSATQVGGLFHDAHEAYLGDLPTPLKNALGPEYRAMVDRVDGAIAARLGIDPERFHWKPVVWADAVALRLEADMLKHSRGTHPEWDAAWDRHNLHDVEPLYALVDGMPDPLPPVLAEAAFLSTWDGLRWR